MDFWNVRKCSIFWKVFFVLLVCFVSFSVYMNIFQRICFHILLNKCPRSVNTFRTKYLFVFFCDFDGFGVLNAHPPPSPASMSKFPSRKNIGKNVFQWFSLIFRLRHWRMSFECICLENMYFKKMDFGESCFWGFEHWKLVWATLNKNNNLR